MNRHPVESGMVKVTGQMLVPVAAGENKVRITLARTPDQKIGGLISVVTGLLILGFMMFQRRTTPLSQP